jgi:hypothetical protein
MTSQPAAPALRLAANELPLYLADVRLFDWLAAMPPASVHGARTVAEQGA